MTSDIELYFHPKLAHPQMHVTDKIAIKAHYRCHHDHTTQT